MDFRLSEEQDILRKFAGEFMLDKCTKQYVRQMEEDSKGFSAEVWQQMAQMGWMGLAFPEVYGGQGMSFLDLTVLLEEMGRACLPGPFFSTVVLGGLTILDVGSEKQKRELLPQIAEGKLLVALALTEPAGDYTPEGISVMAALKAGGYVINGTKLFTADFNSADRVICVARTKDGCEEEAITLFLVDARSPGINHTMLRGIAGDKQAEVVFKDVKVTSADILGELNHGWVAVERIIERGAVGKCAEMVGGARKVLEMTVEYAKSRQQFGKPIGSFQAIQHHCANMATDVEGSRHMTSMAAWKLSQGLACGSDISMAKAWVSESYRRVVALAHQVHGAIGFTLDHDLPLYFRRAKAAELAFGDADYHRSKVAAEARL